MDSLRIAIVYDWPNAVSETFIRAHAERLPAVVAVFHSQNRLPAVDGHAVVPHGRWARAGRSLANAALGSHWSPKVDRAWGGALHGAAATVTLAEYGTTGILVADACQRIGVPLVVHFHGFDAARTDILDRNAVAYRRMFDQAAAVVAVSRAMETQLLRLGCAREKLIYNPYGVDCARFHGADPANTSPQLLAVGRMVEKKAPHLTIASFARVVQEHPDARLRLIGDGVLLGVCRDLAAAMGIAHAVTFLGAQPHEIVEREMRQARALVQHSVTAADGDSEGTPISLLEAGAMGLPVVSTRHAGIPDVVVEGITGFLVEERDVSGMAAHMLTLIRNPALCGELGRNAAAHVRRYYTMEQSIGRLVRVLSAAAGRQGVDTVRASIEGEFSTLSRSLSPEDDDRAKRRTGTGDR